MAKVNQILSVFASAKGLAQKYRHLTGKPLGVTGEIAEYEAAQKLGLQLTAARQTGFDAIENNAGIQRKLQIKGRCILNNTKAS